MKPIDQFHSLLTHLFPQGVSDVQQREMERMFMSGFRACYVTVCYEITSLPDDEAEAKLQEMATELSDYFKLLGSGTDTPNNDPPARE